MHSSTYAKMLRLEQGGPSYAGLSRLLLEGYWGTLGRQRAIGKKLDAVIAALANGEMGPADVAPSLTAILEQLHDDIFSSMLVIWVTSIDALPLVREVEASKMPRRVAGKSSKVEQKDSEVAHA